MAEIMPAMAQYVCYIRQGFRVWPALVYRCSLATFACGLQSQMGIKVDEQWIDRSFPNWEHGTFFARFEDCPFILDGLK